MLNNKNFYPTPTNLIEQMLEEIELRAITTILEPSAGKGDIVDYLAAYSSDKYYSRYNHDIDCVELDPALKATLKGKGHRIVHDDFLTYETLKHYDLIIMNPPFDEGDKHLLKALEMQKNGGMITCILNAETIKNPFSNIRKDLVRKLEEHNATIEYKQGAFRDAERKTGVEIALIKINIPNQVGESIIFEKLKREEIILKGATDYNKIVANDISGIVQQYNFEIKTGVSVIREFEALKPYTLAGFGDNANPIMELKIDNKEGNLVNRYIKKIRRKYWETLFQSDKFSALFTEKLRSKFWKQLDNLTNYDFSVYNIGQLTEQLSSSLSSSVEATILELFETFSHRYNWWDETSQNIHYYNGWKTNSAYKINKKVIIPMSGWFASFGVYDLINKVADIEKVFNYLEDRQINEFIDLRQVLTNAKKEGQSRKIRLQYFDVTFYKKGTCHIEFRDMELLKKFNLFGSQRKGWLPPNYGYKQYQDMAKEEQEIIDAYEGQNEYGKTLENKQFYFYNNTNLKLLGQ